MKKGLKFFFLGGWMSLSAFLFAQEDFPMSYATDLPFLINPAKTAQKSWTSSETPGKYGVDLVYKNQLSKYFNNSYKVVEASFQASFFQEKMGVGVYAFSNTFSRTALNDFSLGLTYAFHEVLAKTSDGKPAHSLSMGLGLVYRYWSYDIERMTLGSMYNPAFVGGYDPGAGSDALLVYEDSRHLFDAQVGVQYRGCLPYNLLLDAGVAVHHLARPKTEFEAEGSRIPFKVMSYAELGWRPGNMGNLDFQLSAFLLYAYQKNHVVDAGVKFACFLSPDLNCGAVLAYRSDQVLSPQIFARMKMLELKLQFDYYLNRPSSNMLGVGISFLF